MNVMQVALLDKLHLRLMPGAILCHLLRHTGEGSAGMRGIINKDHIAILGPKGRDIVERPTQRTGCMRGSEIINIGSQGKVMAGIEDM